MTSNPTRRVFLSAATAAAASGARAAAARLGEKPALLGGKPIRKKSSPSWPVIKKNDEKSWTSVLRSLKWNRSRGRSVDEFETAWAKTMGAKYCLATNGGTTALWAAMNALEVGPKDEVLVPPYTFIATINVVLLQHALPVFVDTDRETFQMDATKIEAAVTPNTRTIMPVHLGGASADMDAILALAGKHNLSVVEDACQSHLAEWKGRPVSTLGDAGCFSFQASKNLNCGEGGALLTNSDALIARAERFHSNGKSFEKSSTPLPHAINGCNVRMTEFQAALLISQMERLETQARLRESNADYLTGMLHEIDGIEPARMYKGCTRNAYHLYMFRYSPESFAGLPRAQFLKALRAEGVGCSSGYTPLNKNPFLKHTFESRAFKKIYSAKEIDRWFERNHMPENDRLCEEAVWFTQSTLLSDRADMEQIASAIRKVQKFATELRDA
jgi:perosamine synthetase